MLMIVRFFFPLSQGRQVKAWAYGVLAQTHPLKFRNPKFVGQKEKKQLPVEFPYLHSYIVQQQDITTRS